MAMASLFSGLGETTVGEVAALHVLLRNMDDVFEPPHLQRIVHEALSGAVDRGVDNLHVAVTAVGLGRKTQSMDVMRELVVDILAYLLNKRFCRPRT